MEKIGFINTHHRIIYHFIAIRHVTYVSREVKH